MPLHNINIDEKFLQFFLHTRDWDLLPNMDLLPKRLKYIYFYSWNAFNEIEWEAHRMFIKEISSLALNYFFPLMTQFFDDLWLHF